MNASKFLIPTVATIAFASIIGIAYAQTSATDAPYNRSNDSTSPDATGTMNRDSTGAMNRGSTDTMNRSATDNRSNERVARADRN